MSTIYVVVTRGNEATAHTKGSAIPKGWTLHEGFETLIFSDAVKKASKLGRKVVRARRAQMTH